MVDVLGEPAFLTSQLAQASATVLGAQALQFHAQPPVAIAHVLDRFARMRLAVTIGGDVRHTEINAKHTVNVLRVKRLNVACDQQIPRATVEQQIAFTVARGKQRPLPFAAEERNRLPSVERPDRNERVGQRKREDPVIVGNTGARAKRAFRRFVTLVGIAHFRERAYRHLRRKTKCCTHILIARLLQGELAKCMRVPGDIAYVVARGVRSRKRALQGIGLFWRRLQLQLCSEFHLLKYSTDRTFVQVLDERRSSGGVHPAAEAGGLPA